MRVHIDALVGLIRRDLLTYTSYRTQVFSLAAGMLTGLTLYWFLSKLVRGPLFPSPRDYFAFVVIGMVIFQVLQSTMGVATALRGELVAGTFERLVLSPFGAVRGMIAMTLFPFVMSIVSSFILLMLAAVIFGVDLRWASVPLAIPIAVLGTGVFTSFGMLLAASTLIFKRAAGGLGFVITLINLTSGLFFPVSLLPWWLRWFSDAQPFSASVNLLRNALVGTPLPHAAWIDIAKMVGYLIVMLPLSVLALQGGLRLAQRRGTIIEY